MKPKPGHIICKECDGRGDYGDPGYHNVGATTCRACSGQGETWPSGRQVVAIVPCSCCNGRGTVICPDCDGNARMTVETPSDTEFIRQQALAKLTDAEKKALGLDAQSIERFSKI